MTKQTQALKLALEALECCVATCFDQYAHEQVMSRPEHFVNQTIAAIREALAEESSGTEQPAQHPKAKEIAECLAVLRPSVKGKFPHEQALEELVGYIAAPQPAQRQPLTDSDLLELVATATPEQIDAWLTIARQHASPQPQRKPLTDEEMYLAIRPLFRTDALAQAALNISKDEYQAIEAAHGIKENT